MPSARSNIEFFLQDPAEFKFGRDDCRMHFSAAMFGEGVIGNAFGSTICAETDQSCFHKKRIRVCGTIEADRDKFRRILRLKGELQNVFPPAAFIHIGECPPVRVCRLCPEKIPGVLRSGTVANKNRARRLGASETHITVVGASVQVDNDAAVRAGRKKIPAAYNPAEYGITFISEILSFSYREGMSRRRG